MSAYHTRLLEFLSNPGSYSHAPGGVRIVQTHISVVALASPWAYKVKKGVNLGFLDFSTLDRRRHFCEREVELNCRLCDGVYEGVFPIFEDEQGRLNFEGGTIVDYFVKMHEIPSAAFLKTRMTVQEGAASRRPPVFPLRAIADRLETFYRERTPLHFEDDAYLDSVWRPIEQNFPPSVEYPPEILPAPVLELLRFFFDRAFSRRRSLLLSRMHSGHVADHHGDLHLDHIVVRPNGEKVCIFDCIEFNDAFRSIDRASDLAFLAMDLDYCGYRLTASSFIEEMARRLAGTGGESTEDTAETSGQKDEGLIVLQDLFRAYRACVRGKVHSLTALSFDSGSEDFLREQGLSRSYFQLALRYALGGIEPLVLASVGRVGSGKSAFSRTSAGWLGISPLSSDAIRKAIYGVPLLERTPETLKPDVYAREASDRTYNRMFADGLEMANHEGIALLDATFSSAEKRDLAVRHFAAAGARLIFVEVTARDGVRRERLEWRNRRPNQSDARLEDLSLLDGLYSEPVEIPPENLVRVDSSDGTKEETATQALRRIIERRLANG